MCSWKAIAVLGVGMTASAIGATAANGAMPVGPPIDIAKPFTIEHGSYALSPLRVPDPDGGPAWSMATYLARPNSNRRLVVVCSEYGRILDGRLGAVTVADVFRPFTPGGGPLVDSRRRLQRSRDTGEIRRRLHDPLVGCHGARRRNMRSRRRADADHRVVRPRDPERGDTRRRALATAPENRRRNAAGRAPRHLHRRDDSGDPDPRDGLRTQRAH